jgi:putative flippase GtrA
MHAYYVFEETPLKTTEDAVGGNPPSTGDARAEHSFRNIAMVRRLIGHIPPGQFVRFLVVGCWNTLFGYSTYAAFTALLMPRLRYGYIVAQLFSFLINITMAYAGYKFFVFKTKGNYLREWLRCMAVYGVGMLPSLILLPFVVAALHYGLHLGSSAPYIAGALLTGLSVFYSFIGHKKFSFRVPEDASDDLIEQVKQGAEAQE